MWSSLNIQILEVLSLMVLPSTAVFFHGQYRGTKSVVPPDTNLNVQYSDKLLYN